MSCRFLHAFFHDLVEVFLESCLGASLRIEDGEVSQTLPLKVPQGASELLWMSAGAMNDTSKLCRLQTMGLVCLMGLGMSLCAKVSTDVICPHKCQKSKNYCHDELLGNRWDKRFAMKMAKCVSRCGNSLRFRLRLKKSLAIAVSMPWCT